jgi:hypothetical protein
MAAYRDYRSYVSMGPHGLPDNFYGWRRQLQMSRKARKDVTVPTPYDIDEAAKAFGPHAKTRFLAKPLTPRDGSRPTIPGFVAPQRQTSQVATEAMKKEMFAYAESLVEANKSMLQFEMSCLEGQVPAVQLKKDVEIPAFLKNTRGEMTHIHPQDGSTHLILSLADSAHIIEKGWGQRHRLSGNILPWSYTLIYAPRNDEDYNVWKNIVNAAASFCCREVAEVVVPVN